MYKVSSETQDNILPVILHKIKQQAYIQWHEGYISIPKGSDAVRSQKEKIRY